jgi:hypothetical protein
VASSPVGMIAVDHPDSGDEGAALRGPRLRARQRAASILVLTTMQAWRPRAWTAARSFLVSFSGGPRSFSVPAMSRIAQKCVSDMASDAVLDVSDILLGLGFGVRHSTRGENWLAH